MYFGLVIIFIIIYMTYPKGGGQHPEVRTPQCIIITTHFQCKQQFLLGKNKSVPTTINIFDGV